ncbi:uncharacterized protein LOC143869838 [Tasmannia lanceolata]|uniref:uncharacterized protein LOC143869838 n=1 Tax=Tasmannia lanceolata TaxID=3420 RepID=UPI00406415B8
MVAALERFISKSAERCLPFFSAVKGLKTAPWTEECQTAFEDLKQYLSSPPLLTKPEPGEELLLYQSVSPLALAAVLVREERSQQKPVYYVSKVLHDAEIIYHRVEKLAYALVMAARKLRPYFQAHTIKVLSRSELSEFDIQYAPRPTIKAQVLADFVVECTIPQQVTEPEIARTPAVERVITNEERPEDGTEEEIISVPAGQDPSPAGPLWEVYVDGSSSKGGSGAGLVLTGPDNFTIDYALRFGFRASNNEAEYEALLAGMNLAVQTGAQILKAYCDSQLKSSIENKTAEVMQVEYESSWMDEIIDYLRSGKLPEAKKEARKVTQRAARFSLDGENLFKRFGIPRILITDNGKQFDCRNFRKFCSDLKIEQKFTSVAHPQTNGQTEVMNRTLLQGIKKRLDDKDGRWAYELYHVLWAYRTTPRTPTGESPFNLSFGIEAVIPVDVGTPSPRVTNFSEQLFNDGLRANLDLLEEAREESQIRVAAYKQKVSNYHDSKIRPREFRARDLVLRKAAISQPKKVGKLSPTWEGPYRVKEVICPGSYRLETLEEHLLPHAWNSKNLRKYYQ